MRRPACGATSRPRGGRGNSETAGANGNPFAPVTGCGYSMATVSVVFTGLGTTRKMPQMPPSKVKDAKSRHR